MDLGKLFDDRYWKAFRDPEILVFLLTGLATTLTIAIAAIILSLFFGTLLALARLSDRVWLRWPSSVYVEIVRALPVIFIIFFVYFWTNIFQDPF